jgi:hypothetical protein
MPSFARRTGRAAAILVALATGPAFGQTQQQRDWCYKDSATDDQTIAGCTALIQSGVTKGTDLASA